MNQFYHKPKPPPYEETFPDFYVDPQCFPEQPNELPPEYDEDEVPDYEIDDEDMEKDILNKLNIQDHENVENVIDQEIMNPQKTRNYVRNIIKKAKTRRNQLKGSKSQVTQAFNKGKITSAERQLRNKQIDDSRAVLNQYINGYETRIKTTVGKGLRRKQKEGNVVFFNDPKYLLKQLQLIIGEMTAGNTSIQMRNTGQAILDTLLRIINMSFTWFNVKSSLDNQKIKYSKDNGSTYTEFTLPAGLRTYKNFNEYIKSQTKIDDKTYPITLKFDDTIFRVEIRLANNYKLDLRDSNFNDLIGFERVVLSSGTHAGPKIPNLSQDTEILNIHCDLIDQSMVDGQETDIIYSFSTSVLNPSFSFTVKPKRVTYSPVNTKRISRIRIDITDAYLDTNIMGKTVPTKGVFHTRAGRYALTYYDAKRLCALHGTVLATYSQLYKAWKAGLGIRL
ncbi:hypothetical protein AWC38_SpisGene23641 [Stylophora pistillata]|uniref:Link domain-containing protein n=1 Tax=Stylophora pistillata TaxID=50429 RepID=A0A2B4R470_STYPI|nr:hypothetical protein AWC38_SpisGene23641 [Stylophora pistillata]